MTKNETVVGIDGCKGGWIAASICNDELKIEKFTSINEIVENIYFDIALIDMIIGLPDKEHQFRPDKQARKILKFLSLSSTVFPAPCRNAVYKETREEQNQENLKEFGKKLTLQTMAIIPKIREVDEFLLKHEDYKKRLMESHPEVYFVSFSGWNLSSKHSASGIISRVELLAKHLPQVTLDFVETEAKKNKCNEDDVVDAICLAVTARLHMRKKTERLPLEYSPKKDAKGLPMQMVVPDFYHANDGVQ